MNHISDSIHAHRFRAMGCQMSIWLELDNREEAASQLSRAEMIFHQIEQRLSRFNPTSELSRQNARPEEWVPLSDELWNVLQTAIIFATETGGLFDPTILTAIEEAGYSRSFETIEKRDNLATPTRISWTSPNDHPGRWQEIRFNPNEQSCWLPSGVGIDLGGIAKGWTAELAVTYLEQYGPCLVDAAGDLTAGSGPQGWPGWPVGIARPGHHETANGSEPGQDEPGQDEPGQDEPGQDELVRLWLSHSSLATSGIDYRRWEIGGEQRHHIIDPTSGKSAATDLLTVSVLDRHPCRAEAWATAAMVAGKIQGHSELSLRQLPAACTSHNAAGELDVLLTPALQQLLRNYDEYQPIN